MQAKKVNIDFYNLGFSYIKTKTMFISEYMEGTWDEGKLIPFGKFEISPAASVLNYGQGLFEGMKALKTRKGEITLFRPCENAKRLNFTAKRLMMPEYDTDQFIKAIKQVVKANEEYIPPYDSGGALYIRPLMIGSGPVMGIKPAEEYKLIIYTNPVGPYFPEGFKGINLEISKKYTRASPGGTGSAKTGGNYVGTMKPALEAKKKGFAQILYLDSVFMEYISEVGAANFCSIIDGKLTTPKFDGTILEGITLKSVLELGKRKLGMKIDQRDISYHELFNDSCTEAFCTGTAAVITPISSIHYERQSKLFNNGKPGEITTELYKILTGIQRLEIEDYFGWITKV
ncbi:MAG: branched-chain amino acid aminotransferase [Promethearchaeota archaeon]|nr:MAG: branched-chain amino acid aminotransferase [Candidatus Lokiarchaeota archaeon]